MEKRELLYSGKAKELYATQDFALCIIVHKDDATALNGQKRGAFAAKGEINNAISARLFGLLAREGIPTHFIKKLNNREMLVHRVRIVPLEVIVRNIAAGSFAARYGVAEGSPLACTVLEYCLKDDALGDPLLNTSHILALNLATPEQLEQIEEMALNIDRILSAFFRSIDIRLIDFKLEFGLSADGRLVLADEISPDSCRLWDAKSGEKLDKDRFRRDLGGFAEAYQEVLRRMEVCV